MPRSVELDVRNVIHKRLVRDDDKRRSILLIRLLTRRQCRKAIASVFKIDECIRGLSKLSPRSSCASDVRSSLIRKQLAHAGATSYSELLIGLGCPLAGHLLHELSTYAFRDVPPGVDLIALQCYRSSMSIGFIVLLSFQIDMIF